MKTEFPKSYLAAAAIFMADKDVRYYLKGVFVECLPNETRLTATDGTIAATLRHKRENEARHDVIVPAEIVAVALKLGRDVLTLEYDGAAWFLADVPFKPVDGTFPPYRRIIPTTWSGEAGHYDPALVARFAKAGKALKRKDVPIIRQSGALSALVHFYDFDDFVGVLMPMRMFNEKHPDVGAPTWGPNV